MTYDLYFNELLHYGVKGMKWGVRNEPIKTTSAKTSRNKSVSTTRINKVSRTKPIRSNVYNRSKTTPKVSKEYTEEVAYNTTGRSSGGSGGGQSANPYENMSEEELMELVKEGKISQEYAEALLDKRLSDSKEYDDVEPKGSKEYNEELASNSKKNNFPNTTTKDLKTNKTWKEKVADGANKVKETIKKIGKTAVSTAKKAVDAGKNALSKLFNVKKKESTVVKNKDSSKKSQANVIEFTLDKNRTVRVRR